MATINRQNYINGNTVMVPEYNPIKKENSEKYKKLDKSKKEAQLKLQRQRTKEKLSVIKMISFLFICGMVMISTCAYVYKMEARLSGYKTEIANLKAENDSLKFTLSKSRNMNVVQDAAINKLQMQMPNAMDALKVDLSKNNFNVAKENIQPQNILDKIKKILF